MGGHAGTLVHFLLPKHWPAQGAAHAKSCPYPATDLLISSGLDFHPRQQHLFRLRKP
jgi:hypothetical protein